jgi:hypothetical protein
VLPRGNLILSFTTIQPEFQRYSSALFLASIVTLLADLLCY